MKIRVLLVFDEMLVRVRLRQMLSGEPSVEIVGECENGHDAITFIQEHHPDLVFLDVQMPEMSGFDVLRALPSKQRPSTIFVSADNQHALEAFEVNALDYLLKPVQAARFREAVQIARKHLQARQAESPAPHRRDGGNPIECAECSNRITVESGERTVIVQFDELDYIESAANYAILHVGKESHILRETLTNLERKLPARQFLRVNRSSIVNLKLVSEVRQASRRDRVVVLTNGKELHMTCGVREILQRLQIV